MEGYAKALKELVCVIAENGGYDSIELL